MVSDHYLENYLSQSFHFHRLIALGKDKNLIDVGLTRSRVKVTRVTFVKKKYSVQYLENYLSHSFHIHVLIGFGENMTCIVFGFTSLVKDQGHKRPF